jgi:hypothetical protein
MDESLSRISPECLCGFVGIDQAVRSFRRGRRSKPRADNWKAPYSAIGLAGHFLCVIRHFLGTIQRPFGSLFKRNPNWRLIGGKRHVHPIYPQQQGDARAKWI